jgi:hypothetical protein
MGRHTARRQFLSTAVTAGAAVLGGCGALSQEVKTETSSRIQPNDAEGLVVTNNVGGVRVRAEDRGDVLVRETKIGPESADFSTFATRTRRRDGTLEVHGESSGDNSNLAPGGSMDLTLIIPESLPIKTVETNFGDTTVEETTGDFSVESRSGKIEIKDTTGDVTVESGSGGVVVDGIDGVAAVDGNSGDVEIDSTTTVGDTSTVDGSVTADINGIDGDTTIETGSGKLTVRLATGLDLEVDAKTEDGDLTVEGPLQEQNVTETTASGTFGDGGSTLSLTTVSGELTIEPQEEGGS